MKFTASHEWIRMQDGIGTVGITHHAQGELGEIVYVELPAVGKQIKAGEEVVVLESTKAAADIYAPVSGEIISVNEHLKEHANKINQDAENGGWLFKVRLSDPKELDHLLNKEQYHTILA